MVWQGSYRSAWLAGQIKNPFEAVEKWYELKPEIFKPARTTNILQSGRENILQFKQKVLFLNYQIKASLTQSR